MKVIWFGEKWQKRLYIHHASGASGPRVLEHKFSSVGRDIQSHIILNVFCLDQSTVATAQSNSPVDV